MKSGKGQSRKMKKKINTWHLFLIPVVMFGFGYLMVPIYDVFCDWTGLNGKTGRTSEAQANTLEVDPDRLVKVEFLSSVNRDAPWDFRAEVKNMTVNPGRQYTAQYIATNKRDHAMVGQAIPSVAPAKAATHFNKIECFCFNQQVFEANQQKLMPLTFVVDPALPADISTVTLSYTFFDVNRQIN